MENKIMKLLLYCTTAKPNLYMPFEHGCFPEAEASKCYLASNPIIDGIDIKVNGKIVAECECEKVELFDMEYHDDSVLQTIHKIRPDFEEPDEEWWERELICTNEDSQSISNCELLKNACLSFDQLGKYACKDGYGIFCALHLKNLKTFDAPKKLKEYAQFSCMKLFGLRVDGCFSIKEAPQNMCYCYDKSGNKYILISIRSEYLCKILNGEKTIEVRKKILNELKELIHDENYL